MASDGPKNGVVTGPSSMDLRNLEDAIIPEAMLGVVTEVVQDQNHAGSNFGGNQEGARRRENFNGGDRGVEVNSRRARRRDCRGRKRKLTDSELEGTAKNSCDKEVEKETNEDIVKASEGVNNKDSLGSQSSRRRKKKWKSRVKQVNEDDAFLKNDWEQP